MAVGDKYNVGSKAGIDTIVASLENLKTQMEGLEALAEKWAELPEDTEVEAGKYSALHHATKAAADAALARQGLKFDDTVTTEANLPAPPPEGDGAAYYVEDTDSKAIYNADTSSWTVTPLQTFFTQTSVEWHGAAGDNIADDHDAFESAITSGASTILLSPGKTYRIASNLVLLNLTGVRIVGFGAKIVSDSSTVTRLFDLDGCDDCGVFGIEFDESGAGRTVDIVSAANCDRLHFERNIVRKCKAAVVSKDSVDGCNDFYIAGNDLLDANWESISTDQDISLLAYGFGDAHRWTLENNLLKGGYHLTLGPKADQWKVHNNRCYNTYDSSIYLRGNSHDITENRIYNAGKDGIKIPEDTTYNVGRENIISGNYVEFPGQVLADGGTGISCQQEFTTISNNKIYLDDPVNLASAGTIGISMVGDDCTAFLNTIKCTNGTGIGILGDTKSIMNSNNIRIKVNTIKGALRAVALTQDTTYELNNAIISYNDFIDCGTGLYITNADKTKMDDLEFIDNSGNGLSNYLFAIFGSSNGLQNAILENNKCKNHTGNYVFRAEGMDSTCIIRSTTTDGSESVALVQGTAAGIKQVNNYSGGYKLGDKNKGESDKLSLTDDSFTQFAPARQNGIMFINIDAVADAAVIAYEIVFGNATVRLIAGSSAIETVSTALNGTTGTDGKLTVGSDGTDIYIENRLGVTRTVSYTLTNSFDP